MCVYIYIYFLGSPQNGHMFEWPLEKKQCPKCLGHPFVQIQFSGCTNFKINTANHLSCVRGKYGASNVKSLKRFSLSSEKWSQKKITCTLLLMSIKSNLVSNEKKSLSKQRRLDSHFHKPTASSCIFAYQKQPRRKFATFPPSHSAPVTHPL